MKFSFSLISTIDSLEYIMPKRRDGIMTVRIPTDEKKLLQAIADRLDVTLSDVVVRSVREFIALNAVPVKKSAAKAPAKAPVKGKGSSHPSKKR
jgi:hypothetical protein